MTEEKANSEQENSVPTGEEAQAPTGAESAPGGQSSATARAEAARAAAAAAAAPAPAGTSGGTGGDGAAVADEGEKDENGNHLLEYKWTLWFDSHQKGHSHTTYGQSRRRVYTFNTVEDFWRLFNNVKSPSDFQPNTDYCLFKEGIEPEWEDPRNANGGAWTINAKEMGKTGTDVDDMWLQGVMACIGEQFDESEEICGLFVSIRARGNRLQLWTKTASNEEAQRSVAKQLKKFLTIASDHQIVYNAHTDQMKDSRRAKEKYVA